ncbi:terminase [Nocardia sp. MH4]|uniref:phage terminase small subunit P27 family n=1 Tax=Nocardia sp. MH4 TaxID=1768677 RepID=UPI001C4E43B8|nr:phage terminase small subunit P27 family [Nocardia sp. MH4]MBW0270769.1 terminase [Nocardia sp. MH4]
MAAPVQRPANLRLLGGRAEGRDSGGRVVTPPPAFRRIPPRPPTWLSREAAAEWKRVVPGLSRLDLLKEEDRAALTAYCETWATYVAAIRDVRKNGLVVENRSTRKDGTEATWSTKNPAVAVAETAAKQLRAWCHEFGLTPSAEARLGRDGGGDEPDDDPFA